jgi:hypothetical protein
LDYLYGDYTQMLEILHNFNFECNLTFVTFHTD